MIKRMTEGDMNGYHGYVRRLGASGKFLAPLLPAGTVTRARLLEASAGKGAIRPRVMLIEGQPGQGKTTLAAQFVSRHDHPAAWITLGPEDADPAMFATSLAAALESHVPHLSFPENDSDPAAWLSALSMELATDIPRFSIVLDGIEMLASSPVSMDMLDTVVRRLSMHADVIMTSRHRLPVRDAVNGMGVWGRVVENAALAADHRESAAMMNRLVDDAASAGDVECIRELVDGWFAGFVFAAESVERVGVETTVRLFTDGTHDGLLSYFSDYALAGFSTEERRTVARIALVEADSSDAVQAVSHDGSGIALMQRMSDEQRFVTDMGAGSGWRMHPLFRHALRRELDAGERAAVLVGASARARNLGRHVEAIRHARSAGACDAVESMLASHGLAVALTPEWPALKKLLSPDECGEDRPWYILMTGLAIFEDTPFVAGRLIDRAARIFRDAGDEKGEAVAASYRIMHHINIDGRFQHVGAILEVAESFFTRAFNSLDPAGQFVLCLGIAYAYCFVMSDTGRASYFSSIALGIAERQASVSGELQVRYVRGFEHGYAGRWDRVMEEIERMTELGRRGAGRFERTLVQMLGLNHLAFRNEWLAFMNATERFIAETPWQLVNQTIFGPSLMILQLFVALNRGDMDAARQLVDAGHGSGTSSGNPHVQSYFRVLEAVLLAQRGVSDEAVLAVRESIGLRDALGGRAHRLRTMQAGAVVMYLCRNYDEARSMLDEIIRVSHAVEDHYFRAGALVYRSQVNLDTGNEHAARLDAADALEIMRQSSYTSVFGWSPGTAVRFLSFAVRHKIESGYASWLGQTFLHTAFDGSGEPYPMLMIKTLGSLEMRMQGGESLTASDFTPHQRELLGILLTAPNRRISQDDIQLALWPDSSAARSRSNLDTLLTRLRKVLARIAGASVKRYFFVSRGIVHLSSCIVDAEEFIRDAEAGLAEMRRQRSWRAETLFNRALGAGMGPFLQEVAANDHVYEMRERIERLLTAVSVARAEIDVRESRFDAADELLEAVFRQMPGNHEIAHELHRLRRRRGQVAAATEVVRRYRHALTRDEYSPGEIDDIIDGITK